MTDKWSMIVWNWSSISKTGDLFVMTVIFMRVFGLIDNNLIVELLFDFRVLLSAEILMSGGMCE